MKTEDFIHEIAEGSRPVRQLDSPVVRFVRWSLISFLCLGVGLAVFGVRPDLESVVQTPSFFLQGFFALSLAVLSALSAFILSVPDKRKPWLHIVPGTTLVLWLGVIVQVFITSNGIHGGLGLSCIRDIVVLGLLPGAFLFLMIGKAAPLKIGRVGLLAGLSVAALGALGTQFICRNDDPLHILLWHYVPVLLLGGIGFFLGRLILKWER